MNQPVLSNLSKVLADPLEPENQKALEDYLKAKEPAEARLARQRKEIDAFFGKKG